MGNKFDLDNAVNSARKAFISYSKSSKEDRISILDRIISSCKKRMDELSKAITIEMGAPKTLSEKAQVPSGLGHFMKAKKILEQFNNSNTGLVVIDGKLIEKPVLREMQRKILIADKINKN